MGGPGAPVRPNRIQHMYRKRASLWPDQLDALTALRRTMARLGRGRGTDSISENTLIRIAIDQYLMYWSDVVGVDENDLRVKVGLPPRAVDGTVVAAAPVSAGRANRIQHMSRKDVFLWPDQLDALTALSRTMARLGRGRGNDSINENTLIRIAIDLYLQHWSHVVGVDENDLRAKVGLPARRTDGTVVAAATPSAPQPRQGSPAASGTTPPPPPPQCTTSPSPQRWAKAAQRLRVRARRLPPPQDGP